MGDGGVMITESTGCRSRKERRQQEDEEGGFSAGEQETRTSSEDRVIIKRPRGKQQPLSTFINLYPALSSFISCSAPHSATYSRSKA